MSRRLPPSASVAEPAGGAKLHAPAAARNIDAITAYVLSCAPATGHALEIASGTGQHVAALATALPGLRWQPTDIEPARLRSIDAHVAEAGATNVLPAQHLDAARPGWAADHGGQDVILLVNLLHLLPERDVRQILDEAARALVPGGILILYGPFARDGALTSAGDQRFDAELRAADPEIGYKDTRDIIAWQHAAGMVPQPPVDMPANNLILPARKPHP